MIRYEVKEKAVYAWNDELEQTDPFLYQPNYPDGTEFSDDEDAKNWADKWYAHFIDPENNPEFPMGPE